MKNLLTGCSGLLIVALLASHAWATFIPDARLSQLRATALNGNGPVASSYDQTVTETGLLVSGPVVHNHFNFFDDDFWGRSETETTMTQTILFSGGGPEGVIVNGSIDPNSVLTRMIRGSGHGAPSLGQGTTDSSFDFTFTVTTAMDWQIDMSATRNPTGDFAVSLYNLTIPGYVYFSPLGPPFTDSASGTLAPGQYKFHARQDTFAQTTPSDGLDSATANFRLQVGVPEPASAALLVLGAALGLRRHRASVRA